MEVWHERGSFEYVCPIFNVETFLVLEMLPAYKLSNPEDSGSIALTFMIVEQTFAMLLK